MAIQTSIKKSYLWMNLLFLVLCIGGGVWGAYSYWIGLPEKYQAVLVYEGLMLEQADLNNRAAFQKIEAKVRTGTASMDERAKFERLRKEMPEAMAPLTDEDRSRFEAINFILADDFKNTPPKVPASYDGPIYFYVWFLACGVLCAPWFLWKLASRWGLKWTLEEDGTLITPDGTYSRDQVIGIDMSKWMKKSTASVRIEGADDVILDDFEHQNTYRIVGALAHRFHPDAWTEDAKPVKDMDRSEESDSSESDLDSTDDPA